MNSINQRLEEIEKRQVGAFRDYYVLVDEDIPKLLALARYIIPLAEDHLTIDESREFQKKVEEILQG